MAIGVLTILSALISFRFEDSREMQLASNRIHERMGKCTLLKVKRPFLALLNYALLDAILVTLDPILSLKLANDYSFSA